MLDYVDVLFSEKFITLQDRIVLGKPFGSQTYYLVWRKLGYLTDIENLSIGVKHDEVVFVDYSEETMGNALGVAIGIALTTTDRVWVNITDASLQMGNTLEAIQFIGHHQIKNIFVTVDYNNAQVTGNTRDILAVDPVIPMFIGYNWACHIINGHNKDELRETFSNLDADRPNVVFCNTRKGYGVQQMEEDVKKWHYRKIQDQTELQLLVAELRDI
jgi:transketolase N-terminal domain/subunit